MGKLDTPENLPFEQLQSPTTTPTNRLGQLLPDIGLLQLHKSSWKDQPARLRKFSEFQSRHPDVDPTALKLLKAAADYETQDRLGRYQPCAVDAEWAASHLADDLHRTIMHGRAGGPCSVVIDMGVPRRLVVSPGRDTDLLVAEIALLIREIPTIDGIDVTVSRHHTAPFLTALTKTLQSDAPNVELQLIGHPDHDLPDGGRALAGAIPNFLGTRSTSLLLDSVDLGPIGLWRLLEGLASDTHKLSCLSTHWADSAGIPALYDALGRSQLDKLVQNLESLSILKFGGEAPSLPETVPYLPWLLKLSVSLSALNEKALARLLSVEETPSLVNFDVQNCHLISADSQIFEQISKRDSIRSLTLAHHNFKGAESQSPFYRLPPALEILSFHGSTIYPDHFQALQHLGSLKRLDLSYCKLSNQCVAGLSELVAQGRIKELDLRGVRMEYPQLFGLLSESDDLRIQLSVGSDESPHITYIDTWYELSERFGEHRVIPFGL